MINGSRWLDPLTSIIHGNEQIVRGNPRISITGRYLSPITHKRVVDKKDERDLFPLSNLLSYDLLQLSSWFIYLLWDSRNTTRDHTHSYLDTNVNQIDIITK